MAVAAVSQFGGRFREEPIYVGNHKPPPFRDVPDLMDRFISFIHENRDNLTPAQLAGYEALRSCDRAWREGHLDIAPMGAYLAGLLEAQLADLD